MLILSRKASVYNSDNNVINIGDDIIVKILSVEGGQVKIGIDAPKHVPVHREEIFKKSSKALRYNADGEL